MPQTIYFDYANTSQCIGSPRLFPSLLQTKNEGAFSVHRPGGISVGGIRLYSPRLCAMVARVPEAQRTYVSHERLFGWQVAGHQVEVKAAAYPSLANHSKDIQMVPPDLPLQLKLDTSDKTFGYAVYAGESAAPCTLNNALLSCNLSPLRLAYATEYDLQLTRLYNNKPVGILRTVAVRTITPVTVTATSIQPGESVEQKPAGLVITTDKKLSSIGEVTLVARDAAGVETIVPAVATIDGVAIKVTFGTELARKVAFELRVASARAEDDSGFTGGAYTLPFTTSGGPKVKAVNIGSYDVGFTQSIVVSFDQNLMAAQDMSKVTSLRVNGSPVVTGLTVSGNTLTIRPPAMPVCARIAISLTADIQSQYGTAGDSAWSYNSRATCYSTINIGTSVRGRAITAYKFGSGSTVLYVGAMHGDEANSKQIMLEWITELNRNPDRIPAGRSLVVIPTANPDGIAANTRFNASNVDLNRNFPANDWKSEVTTPTSAQPSAAGGPSPLSEPESKALANYIGQLSPVVVFTFHSKAAVAEANEAGNSVSIAAQYAAKASYRAIPKSQSEGIFNYDTTGALEDWLRDKQGRPAVVVELASSTSSEFSRNREALWYTTGL